MPIKWVDSSQDLPQICHKRNAAGVINPPQVFENNRWGVRREVATHWFLARWSPCFALRSVERKSFVCNSGEPSRTRTCDPLVKSQLLYQLSYRPTLKRSDSLRFQVSSFKFALRRAIVRLDVVHVIRRLHIDPVPECVARKLTSSGRNVRLNLKPVIGN
jgi:hypothetical protein